MDKIIWHPERRKVSQLFVWKNNPRKITGEAFAKLKERIQQRGFHDVIKIDTDGVILSGNQRKKALTDLGINEITVLIPSRKLTEEERNKVALESNNNDGDWDFEALKSFDLDMLLDIGFDHIDLDTAWKTDLEVKEDKFDEAEELKNIKVPETRLGDLILLGKHKLICGDSTNPEVLQKLFGNERASMIYSDPVYNINLNYNKGIGGKQDYGGNVMDKRTDLEYKEFIRKSMISALSVVHTDAHVFYWCDESYIWLMQTVYRELGIDNKRVCLWIKNGHNPTPNVAFNKCYEPCVYGTIGKPYITKSIQNLNEVMNPEIGTGNDLMEETENQVNIWTAKRLASKDYKHATSKPPALHEKAIKRCTKLGDIILDSFSGSGSTLIAGEQLKRRVYAVELEPIFCDLTIKRFEKLTGIKAKIVRT